MNAPTRIYAYIRYSNLSIAMTTYMEKNLKLYGKDIVYPKPINKLLLMMSLIRDKTRQSFHTFFYFVAYFYGLSDIATRLL